MSNADEAGRRLYSCRTGNSSRRSRRSANRTPAWGNATRRCRCWASWRRCWRARAGPRG